jgi:formate dehydrogenase subunit gamma
MLEVLHAIQDELGYIDPRAVPIVADALNCSKAEVRGVISFYRDLRTSPPPRLTLRLCRAEACQSVGAEELVEYASSRLRVRLGEQTADGAFGLEQVFCLGNCALGPSAMVGDRLVGRLDRERLAALLDELVPTTSEDRS